MLHGNVTVKYIFVIYILYLFLTMPKTKYSQCMKSAILSPLKFGINKICKTNRNNIRKIVQMIKGLVASTINRKSINAALLKMLPGQNRQIGNNENVIISSHDYEAIKWKLRERILNVPVEPREENFFIEPEQHGSSRHYAGFLWNYRLLYQAERRNRGHQFILKCICLMLKSMAEIDIKVLMELLTTKNRALFPIPENINDRKSIMSYLLHKILFREDSLQMLVNIIREWFIKMPLLQELSYQISWEYILKFQACLLSVDDLYNAYLLTRTKE